MLSYLRNFLLGALAFFLGLIVTNSQATQTTIEDISRDISSFEGRTVVVDTYAQFQNEQGWTIGEPFEKYERSTFIEADYAGLSYLEPQFAHDFSAQSHYRVKVRATGTVEDNCNDGSTCCFGETMTLKNGTLAVIGDVEVYTRPYR